MKLLFDHHLYSQIVELPHATGRGILVLFKKTARELRSAAVRGG